MKIRMLVQMPEAGRRNGEPWPAEGEIADLPDADAAHYVASGIAELVTEDDDQTVPRRSAGRKSGGKGGAR